MSSISSVAVSSSGDSVGLGDDEVVVDGVSDHDYLESACRDAVVDLPSDVSDSNVPAVVGASNGSKAKNWCFTMNNYSAADELYIQRNRRSYVYMVYGREVSASGTPHLQGFVSFATRVRLTQCIERVGRAHFSVARMIENSVKYCKKDGDYVEYGVMPQGRGKRSDLDEFKAAVSSGVYDMKKLREEFSHVVAKYPKFVSDYVIDNMPQNQVECFPLRPWQAALYDSLKMAPDSRHIYFIVDTRGNAGKSWFGHYYCSLHENAQVLLPGKKVDMAYALRVDVRVLFVDAPRSKQGEFIQYDFLEDVKNGYVFSPKYESRVKRLAPCHVVVFMNETPDMNKLSLDRYIVRNVTGP